MNSDGIMVIIISIACVIFMIALYNYKPETEIEARTYSRPKPKTAAPNSRPKKKELKLKLIEEDRSPFTCFSHSKISKEVTLPTEIPIIKILCFHHTINGDRIFIRMDTITMKMHKEFTNIRKWRLNCTSTSTGYFPVPSAFFFQKKGDR